jgi:UDPglucose 6-dehydrogenase
MAADLKYIELCRQIAKIAKDDKMVVEKSTLPVRTEAIKSILDNAQMGAISDSI